MSAPDVALISPYPSTDRSHHAGSSGVASYTANLARSLRDIGTRVDVFAPDDEPCVEEDGDGIRIERGFGTGANGLSGACRAARASGAPIAHLQFELFLYGGPTVLPVALHAIGGGRRKDVKTAVTMHQTVDPATVDRSYTDLHRVALPPTFARMGIDAVQRGLRRRADVTIVHEAPFRSVIGGAEVIPHGIERTGTVERAEARARLGLDPDRFVALCFGFVAPYKGLEAALEAGVRAGPSVEIVVAGGEHPRLAAASDDYAAALQDRYGAGATFTGWVPGEHVIDWFCAADVALFPYPKPFSSSGALALALACDTPVLLSAPLARCIGAPSHLVATDAEDMGHRLRTLADDPDDLLALGTWTSCLAAGRTWPAVARRHREVYERVAA